MKRILYQGQVLQIEAHLDEGFLMIRFNEALLSINVLATLCKEKAPTFSI
jgi:hypothetical protein